jgi:hypothetical protein
MFSRSLAVRLAWLFVLLGLFLRGYHYLRDRPVWHDEASVMINVLERDYGQLLGGLRFHEAAPPLFLWLHRAGALTLGDSPPAFRLPEFLASCAALLLLASVAWALLPPAAVPWALLLFACSEGLLWHACEAKPYAIDVFVACLLLALWVHAREGRLALWLLAFAGLAPFLIFLSYPACFLLGAVLLAFLPRLWAERRLAPCLAYGAFLFTTCGAFYLLLIGPVRAQHDPTLHAAWVSSLPDWGRPGSVPGWAFLSTFEVFRYCCKPLGQPLFLFALVGAFCLWKAGQRDWLILCAAPVGLNLLAALMQRYPYGGARVVVFAAPGLLLLTAAGIPNTLNWLWRRNRVAWLGALLLLLLPVGTAARRVVFPWDEADIPGAVAFVQAERQDGEGVMGNDWTHLYYFRQLGPSFFWVYDRPLDRPLEDLPERFWIVVTDSDSAHSGRLDLARAFVPGWHLCQERAFRHTSVYLFLKPGSLLAGRFLTPEANLRREKDTACEP